MSEPQLKRPRVQLTRAKETKLDSGGKADSSALKLEPAVALRPAVSPKGQEEKLTLTPASASRGSRGERERRSEQERPSERRKERDSDRGADKGTEPAAVREESPREDERAPERAKSSKEPRPPTKAKPVEPTKSTSAKLKPHTAAAAAALPAVASTHRRPAEIEQAAAEAMEAPGGNEQVVFNVAGRLFRVSAGLVKAHPAGRLARLLEATPKPSQNDRQPRTIFVDGAPERFSLILDWYRYGEIHVPRSVPVASVLQDARWLQLPDEIVVNGVMRTTDTCHAHKVTHEAVEIVIAKWSNFAAFFKGVLERIEAHYKSVANSSSKSPEGEEAYDFQPLVLPLCGERGWADPKNVCSAARARVLALRLEEHGYACEFTETELVILLPTQLRSETGGAAGGDGDGDGAEDMET